MLRKMHRKDINIAGKGIDVKKAREQSEGPDRRDAVG